MLGNREHIFVAPAAHVQDDQAVRSELLRHFPDAGERVGRLQRRDDAFEFGAELERLKRFLVCR